MFFVLAEILTIIRVHLRNSDISAIDTTDVWSEISVYLSDLRKDISRFLFVEFRIFLSQS